MIKSKIKVLIGLFNILFYIFLEILWTFDFPVYHFNIINIAGILSLVVNASGLYLIKKEENKKIMIVLIALIVLSLFQIISIDAIQYSFFYVVLGVLCICLNETKL